jgi:hypothetical protein
VTLPDGITREHLLRAISDLDAVADNPFAPSTHYDVVFEGCHYAPKAVVARAALLATGVRLVPDDFSAGMDTKCFRILRENGLEVVPKQPPVDESKTYLLGWNPKRFPWGSLEDELALVRDEGSLSARWSVGNNTSIRPGDRVFLIRLGAEPRGMVGSGYATSEPYPGEHWDPKRAEEGATAHFIDFVLDTLSEVPLIPIDVLNSGSLSGFHWSTQMSGVHIPKAIAKELESMWPEVAEGASGVGFPGESASPRALPEGAAKTVYVNRYERNPAARARFAG